MPEEDKSLPEIPGNDEGNEISKGLRAILTLLFPPSFSFIILAASALDIFSAFFHLVLLFWNQIFTCRNFHCKFVFIFFICLKDFCWLPVAGLHPGCWPSPPSQQRTGISCFQNIFPAQISAFQ